MRSMMGRGSIQVFQEDMGKYGNFVLGGRQVHFCNEFAELERPKGPCRNIKIHRGLVIFNFHFGEIENSYFF